MNGSGDDFNGRMLAAINGMMLDMLAAIARKDYEDRRRRQAEGIAKVKAAGGYTGRPEDTKRNAGIADMLARGMSYSAIQAATAPAARRLPRSRHARRAPSRGATRSCRPRHSQAAGSARAGGFLRFSTCTVHATGRTAPNPNTWRNA